MYGFIWKHLPGPKFLKIIEASLIIFCIVALLFLYGFPWLSENTNIGSITIN